MHNVSHLNSSVVECPLPMQEVVALIPCHTMGIKKYVSEFPPLKYSITNVALASLNLFWWCHIQLDEVLKMINVNCNIL